MTFEVSIDQAKCQAYAQCIDEAPKVFAINADGKTEVLLPQPDDEFRGAVEDAAELCPMQAILLRR